MNLNEILCGIDSEIISGSKMKEIEGISLDSRKVDQNYMFVAIKGERTDGHNHIQDAVIRGARTVVCESLPNIKDERTTYIKVTDTSLALARIAANFYDNPSDYLYLAGITGTNGKTTLTYLLESLWKKQGKITGLIGTIENRYAGVTDNSIMTTPDSIELTMLLDKMRRSGVDNVTMEVSSHAIDRKRVYGCNFDTAVFTNITQDHLDYHKTFDNYFKTKKKFFTELLEHSTKKKKTAVINIDDRYGRVIASEISSDIITYSTENNKAEVFSSEIELLQNGIQALVHTPYGNIKLRSSLVGRHNLYNLLAAVSVCISQDFDLGSLEEFLSERTIIPGRLERIQNNAGMNVLVDYAHTPDALENVLSTLRAITKGRLIVVFGCGGDRDRGKRPKMGKIAYQMSDLAIITSDNPRTENPEDIIKDIIQGIDKTLEREYLAVENREQAIEKAIGIAKKEDVVLIAGKGHEDYQIIGTNKIHFDDREIAKQYLIERERSEV